MPVSRASYSFVNLEFGIYNPKLLRIGRMGSVKIFVDQNGQPFQHLVLADLTLDMLGNDLFQFRFGQASCTTGIRPLLVAPIAGVIVESMGLSAPPDHRSAAEHQSATICLIGQYFVDIGLCPARPGTRAEGIAVEGLGDFLGRILS